jgi:Zn-dependent protease
LPILPLDGGHVLETVLEMNRVPQAKVRARWFSVCVAVALGVISILSATENMPKGWYETTIMQWFRPTIFMGLFMFVLAVINYQQLQSMRASEGFSGSFRPSWRGDDDDGEAWKRR